jgi:hypothetical protein
MHVGDMLLWGLLATGLLTTVLRAGQALHLTRMGYGPGTRDHGHR